MAACGAADTRLDPSELDLRDLLGIAPETALSWDATQRTSAREVLDTAMRDAHSAPADAALGRDPAVDRSIATALAAVDADRAKHRAPALGVIHLAVAGTTVHVAPSRATLAPHATASIEVALSGWDRPGWSELPARGLDVLTTIAADAGHASGPLVVAAAPQLAAIAAYVPASGATPARLVVNPVLLAALEPVDHASAATNGTATATHATERAALRTLTTAIAEHGGTAQHATLRTIAAPANPAAPPVVMALAPADNPYSFYDSVGACASAQRTRCEACMPQGNCAPLVKPGDGNAECAQLAAGSGRGYSLVCINMALAIDSVANCTEAGAPSCSFDANAGRSITALDHNANFLDQPIICGKPLDACLASIFGNAPAPTPSQPDTSPGCADSACDSATCDAESASCDDGGGCDGGGDTSGGDCSGGDSGDGSCDGGGDSGGDCSGGDSGGDCSGGDSGGDCGGGGGGDCGGDSGGDCSGGGGDCGGGGGDCSGGGGDCNAGHRRRGDGTTYAFLWACLPLPFALIVSRRAARRRAIREAARREAADREVAP